MDRIDPFAKRSLKKKQKKSQGSSRYRQGGDVELQALPLLKGKKFRGKVLIVASRALICLFKEAPVRQHSVCCCLKKTPSNVVLYSDS